MTCIETLPPELVCHVVMFLDTSSIGWFSSTSKRIHELCKPQLQNLHKIYLARPKYYKVNIYRECDILSAFIKVVQETANINSQT